MEIKMMKGCPAKLVRVSLDLTFKDLAKVEKFCPAKLTFIDPESKKVTFRIDLTEKGLHTAALGVADAAAAPTEKVCLNFITEYDKEDLAIYMELIKAHFYADGIINCPYIENGNIIEEITPTLLRETVSKSTSNTLKDYLYATVSEGTGKTAKVDGYSLGGKTGTAQKLPRGSGNYLVSFIGFAPVEDPQLVIYCIVDEPNTDDQPHSTFAQNIVREILEEILPYMNIYPDEATTGLHAGWDITGKDTGSVATTDIVTGNAELPEEEPENIPDTITDLIGASGNAN